MFGRWGFFCDRLFEKSNSDWHCLVLPHLSETYGGLLFFFGGGGIFLWQGWGSDTGRRAGACPDSLPLTSAR